MTGRIRVLNNATSSGIITADNGLRVRFELAAVLAYDQNALAVGQHVTFDLNSGQTAVNICVERLHHPPRTEEKRPVAAPVRYMGFDQKGAVRTYRFERLGPGDEPEMFLVEADVALFARHHVGIQEGPTLCLRLLLAELQAVNAGQRPVVQCSLTDRELLAYIASRPVPPARSGPKRKARAVGEAAPAC